MVNAASVGRGMVCVPISDNRVIVKPAPHDGPTRIGDGGVVRQFSTKEERDAFIKMMNKKAAVVVPAAKAPSFKSMAIGVSSLMVPGLGQIINGQWGKGIGHSLLAGVAALSGLLIAGPVGMTVAGTLFAAYSAYDAAKVANQKAAAKAAEKKDVQKA